jgi:hypothetical protein
MPVENTLNDQQKAAVQYSGDAQNVLVITGSIVRKDEGPLFKTQFLKF